ncbi:MAG: cytidylate kinase-like family protein [Lachnospiraceae bacterium]|nr:cytidylate kinase-like family protein [Lachnospiraceae bacterium]
MKDNIVITIGRQYGSGGRTVGEMLAKDLGINYYDRHLLRLASDDSGINEELFVKADESLKRTSLFRVARKVYNGELIPPDKAGFTSNRNLFNYQAKIIKELAETESCVIVGRCADYVLKNYENVVRVFVYAPRWFLMQEAGKVQSLTGAELERYIDKTDKERADYYNYYTDQIWTDARNYDLCLDSSKLGFEKCVEAIKSYIRVRFGEDALER